MNSFLERPLGPSDQDTAPTSATVIPRRPSRSRQCCQHVRRSARVAAGGGYPSNISTGDVDSNAILASLTALPVDRWTYTGIHADGKEYLGPYAEDVKEALGVGDGRTIHVIDMMGALLSAVQALSAKVEKLEAGG